MALGVYHQGFVAQTIAPGGATVTSQVIRLDSPWSTPYVKFQLSSEAGVACACQIQISPDKNIWLNHGTVLSSGTATTTGVLATSTYGLPNAGYIRFLAGSNTTATAIVDSWVSFISPDGMAPGSSPVTAT